MTTSVMLAALGVVAVTLAWLLCGPEGRWRRAGLLASGGARAGALRLERTGSAREASWRDQPAVKGPSERWNTAMDVLRSAVRPVTDRLGKEALCPPAGLVMAVLLDSPVPLIAGVLAVPLVRRRLRQAEESKAAARCRAGVIELCDVLAAETRTGRPVNVVLAEAVGNRAWPAGRRTRDAVAGVLAAARFGGDVPTALRALALIPGGEGLRGVAACWQVGVDSGAGLAGGLDRVASGLRAEEQRREELAAQLAGPRATAVLLGVLPLFGLLLGAAMGAAPLDVLLHTPAGLGCLGLGGALEWAGAAWTARIVRGAS